MAQGGNTIHSRPWETRSHRHRERRVTELPTLKYLQLGPASRLLSVRGRPAALLGTEGQRLCFSETSGDRGAFSPEGPRPASLCLPTRVAGRKEPAGVEGFG